MSSYYFGGERGAGGRVGAGGRAGGAGRAGPGFEPAPALLPLLPFRERPRPAVTFLGAAFVLSTEASPSSSSSSTSSIGLKVTVPVAELGGFSAVGRNGAVDRFKTKY